MLKYTPVPSPSLDWFRSTAVSLPAYLASCSSRDIPSQVASKHGCVDSDAQHIRQVVDLQEYEYVHSFSNQYVCLRLHGKCTKQSLATQADIIIPQSNAGLH